MTRGVGKLGETERGAETVNRKMSRLIFINRQMLSHQTDTENFKSGGTDKSLQVRSDVMRFEGLFNEEKATKRTEVGMILKKNASLV